MKIRQLAIPALICMATALPLAGYEPVLKTIQVNGIFEDWETVLANSPQVTPDADGSTISCDLSEDLDCKVQSRQRDLREFAWTYDEELVYVYVRRHGASSSEMSFWFYIDLGGDPREPQDLQGGAWYLVRSRNVCGTGSWGRNGFGREREIPDPGCEAPPPR